METVNQTYARYRAPFLFFGGVWLAAVAFLAARGLWSWVGRATGGAAILALFVALTLLLTRARPPLPEGDGPAPRESRARLGAQLVVALALAVLAAARFQGLAGWQAVVDLLYQLGRAAPFPNANYLVNPILYAVLPGALVLALGARWRGIGFRRGWRVWRVIGLWSAPVVAAWVFYLATGRVGVGRILRALVSNLFQNGFGEELLWRGIIQTRLARLWTPEWGLILASLCFGWWHLDSIHDWAGDDLLLAAALNVVVQAPMGLALGVIFDRTRNLLAPTVVHVVANSVEV